MGKGKKKGGGDKKPQNKADDGDDGSNPLPVTKTILGVSEVHLVLLSSEDRNKRFVRDGCFLNENTGSLISFGSFDTPTVEALREQVAQLPSAGNTGKKAPPLTTRSGVDIGELQGQLTTADRAMVQVASNFNCLENGSRRTHINSGDLVDHAHCDHTQGPAAVFGTTSAYLYRCHFYGGGQSLGNPVNLLQHVPQYFGTPEVGKLTLSGTETPLKKEADIDPAASKVCIGLHKDCPVMFGRSNRALSYNEMYKKNPDGPLEFPLVDQVLSASINVWDFGVSSHSQEAMVHLTQALLRAAYEGIYLAAILRQRRKLYLTLVGGGSFGNPIPLIVEEIQRAHQKWASHPASVLKEVTICLYSQEDENSVKAAMTKGKKGNDDSDDDKKKRKTNDKKDDGKKKKDKKAN